MQMLTVEVTINAPLDKVWDYWTKEEHVVQWNAASNDWHCPKATNNLTVGGEFHYLMAAKDNSFEFDFWGTYQHIETKKRIDIVLGDNRKMHVLFASSEQGTIVTESFEPEQMNSIELQQAGWQAILNRFKQYVEA